MAEPSEKKKDLEAEAPGVEKSAEKPADDAKPAEAKPPAEAADPNATTELENERRHGKDRDRRKAEKKPRTLAVPRVAPGTRTENVVAVFLLGVIVGCAGIWVEHNHCPGALKTAALAAAPPSFALAVPIGVFLAWIEKTAPRPLKIRRSILFAVWAGAAFLSLGTGGLLRVNESGATIAVNARCYVSDRETVAAPEAGVADWILVVSCSDRMSSVRIDVDRDRWWKNEPGTSVQAKLLEGTLGFQWVVDVVDLGPPTRSL